MARDFLGLSLKEPLYMVKEETNNDLFKDPGFNRGSSSQWTFSNKVSALPHFMAFKVAQEERMRKNVSEHQISSGFGPFSTTMEPFEHSQNRSILEFQKSFNHEMYSAHRPHDSRLSSIPTVKQQLLGGIPVTSPNTVLPTVCSFASIAEPWNNTKPSGSPAQLTIFYGGSVNVYEDISPEKAQAIMFLAGSSSSLGSSAVNMKSQVLTPASRMTAGDGSMPSSGLSSPASASSTQSGSGSTNTDDLMAAKTAGVLTSPLVVSAIETHKLMNPQNSAMIPSAIPQARKASLARFLEKRKERMMNSAPYNFCKSSSECTDGANFAIASPAVDSLHYY